MVKKIVLAALAAGLLGGTAHAGAFMDGSFETVTAPTNSYQPYSAGASLGPWVVSTGQVDLIHTGYLNPDFIASDGLNSLDMNGSNGTLGGVAQTFDTVAGALYTVTFDMNANVYDRFIGMKNVLAQVAAFSQEFGYNTALHPVGLGGPWVTHSFDFVALGSSSTLSFTSTYSGGGNVYGALLDNVTVTVVAPGTGAVPEPASWAMMIGGLALAGAAMRRSATRVAFA